MKYVRLLLLLCIGLGLTAAPAAAKTRSLQLVNENVHRVVVSVSREDRKKFESWVLEAHGTRGSSAFVKVEDHDKLLIFYVGQIGCVEEKFPVNPRQHVTGFTMHKSCRISS